MQGFVPVMWSIWGAVIFVLVALKVYSLRLTRDEDDQIILDDSFSHLRTEQAAIVEKVHKIEPITKATTWAAVAASLVVVGYYGVNFYSQFK